MKAQAISVARVKLLHPCAQGRAAGTVVNQHAQLRRDDRRGNEEVAGFAMENVNP